MEPRFIRAIKTVTTKETTILSGSNSAVNTTIIKTVTAKTTSIRRDLLIPVAPHHKFQIISINDVYVLDALPSLFSALVEIRGKEPLVPSILVLPGDFLSPSLLSSLDYGAGMVHILNKLNLDFVCLGNHEDDVPFSILLDRIRQSKFKWIVSNMPNLNIPHDLKHKVPEYITIEIPDQNNLDTAKKVILLGLCTDDKSLYKPRHFGNADILPVYETAQKYALEHHKVSDLVIPLTHQEISRDRILADSGAFRVIVGGHDHVPFHETINGCQIIKTGQDAKKFAIINISWTPTVSSSPTVAITLEDTLSYPPNPRILQKVQRHMHAVDLLRASTLCKIPESLVLSSQHVRARPVTVAIFLCSILRRATHADCAILNAGMIRGNKLYPAEGTDFTYVDLQAELPYKSEISVIQLPGSVIAEMIEYSRAPALQIPPVEKGGYLQTCDAVTWDSATNKVTHIKNKPLKPSRMYKVAMSYQILMGMDDIEPLLEYLAKHPPRSEYSDFQGAKEIIISYFTLSLWHDILLSESFETIDQDGDGALSKDDVVAAFKRHFGDDTRALSETIVSNIFAVANVENVGQITREELLKLKLFALESIDFGNIDDNSIAESKEELNTSEIGLAETSGDVAQKIARDESMSALDAISMTASCIERAA